MTDTPDDEALVREAEDGLRNFAYGPGAHMVRRLATALAASRPTVGVPEGWVLVPRRIAPPMLATTAIETGAPSAEDYATAEKAIDLLPPTQHPDALEVLAELCRDYRIALAAAPAPPTLDAGEGGNADSA